MPAGDNQHAFTCAGCAVRKEVAIKCPASGLCNECCRGRNACRDMCDRCNVRFFQCKPRPGYPSDPLPDGCEICMRHNPGCTPVNEGHAVYHGCVCSTCDECGIKRPTSNFWRYGPRQCSDCHHKEELRTLGSGMALTCKHCPYCASLVCESNPAMTECCERCQGCCKAHGCNGKSKVKYINMPMVADPKTGDMVPVKKLAKVGQFQFNPIKRTLGFEVEATAYHGGKKITQAVEALGGAIVSDGSVGTAGFEINTPPMNGDVLVHGLAYLSSVLVEQGARAGPKAGLHIHVDCSDMEYADMRRMIMLYGRLESGLFSIIDSRRLTGGYCKPNGGRLLLSALANPVHPVADIVNMVYTRKPEKGWESWTKGKACDGDRYWAMNVHSWFLRGTVEFRLHHGTIQWEKMLGMGMVLGAIADGALSIPEREIVNFPQGREGLLRIAPTQWCKDWVKSRWDHFAQKRKNKDEPIADF